MTNKNIRVCVTGGSGLVGSWLIKKLLQKGYHVHATLRNLDDNSKTNLLKSFPNGGTRLSLFKADIYNPQDFELAIKDCTYVFHVASPLFHTQNTKYKDTAEAAVAGARAIAESCLRSETVRRLIYTASVMSASPLREDGNGYKYEMDELCWTPLNLSYSYSSDYSLDYIKSKTLSEKEILSYNIYDNYDDDEIGKGKKLEVVSLACGLVGGDTLLPSITLSSLGCVLSQLTSDQFGLNGLRLLEELLGSIPLVHIDDVCEAHIFCMEKSTIKGRFFCAADSPIMEDMANCYQEILPEFQIPQDFTQGPGRRSKCDVSKLRKEGFEYKYGLNDILNDSLRCAKRLGIL